MWRCRPDEHFYDYQLAVAAAQQIALATNGSESAPFFIAAGIRRPHRVWHVPRRFYDMSVLFCSLLPLSLQSELPNSRFGMSAKKYQSCYFVEPGAL
jgi:hypothetical protein